MGLYGLLARVLIALLIAWLGLFVVVNVINAYLPVSAFEQVDSTEEFLFQNSPLVDSEDLMDTIGEFGEPGQGSDLGEDAEEDEEPIDDDQ